MTDNISNNFSSMGFTPASNQSETKSNILPTVAIGPTLVYAATTAGTILKSENGSQFASCTPGLLASVGGIAVSDKGVVIVGTNPAGATTAPVIFSSNYRSFTKCSSTAPLLLNPLRCVVFSHNANVYYAGGVATVDNDDSVIQVISAGGLISVVSGGGSTIFGTINDVCNSIDVDSKGSSRYVAHAGGQNAAGTAPRLGFATTAAFGGASLYNAQNNVPNGGAVNAVCCDNGTLSAGTVNTYFGGTLTGNAAATSRLVYVTHDVGTDPAVGNTFTPAGAGVFGNVACNITAIACNGSRVLVGGTDLIIGAGTGFGIAISDGTLAGFSIPTGSNAATYFTSVNSLAWNNTYWFAAGVNANGDVFATSLDGTTWMPINTVLAGQTGQEVASLFTLQ